MMTNRNRKIFLHLTWISVAVAVLILMSPFSWAQVSTTATVNGTVTDPAGAAVPGARVAITNIGTKAVTESLSNNTGRFTLTGLPVGTYVITVSKPGFSSFSETGIYLGPSVVRSVNVALKLASQATRMTVAASAVQVQTSSSEISSHVAEEQVKTLPMNGRNYGALAALMPGVVNLNVGQTLGTGGYTTSNAMSINGAGLNGTLYVVDGMWSSSTPTMQQTTIIPNPDEIQEVRVLQNNYNPEYSLMGANVVLVETKSGTQAFHGDAWEYFRNDAFDSRNFFSPTVPVLKQNIFGFDIGGPAFVPGLYNTQKDKTFFYVNEQWVRRSQASVLSGATPTAAMREGIFNTPITDPTTGQPFPQVAPGQYQIPSSMINPNSLAFINAWYPAPNNSSGGFLNYLNLNPTIFNQLDSDIKINQIVSSRLRLTAQYIRSTPTLDSPGETLFLGSPFSTNSDHIANRNQLAQIQLTQQLSPNMVNQTSIAMNNGNVSLELNGISQLSQIPNFHQSLPFQGANSTKLPQITLSGGWSPAGVSYLIPLPHSSSLDDSFTDNWSWLRGNHFLQAGTNVDLGTQRQNNFAATNGEWTFSGQFTGNAMADFLLGDAATFTQQSVQRRFYGHYTIVSPYFQDSWKATRRLTITGGLRISYLPVPHSQGNGFEDIFDPSRYNPAEAPMVSTGGIITTTPNYNPINGLIFNGLNGVPINFTTENEYYWQPQVGFAWDVFGDGRTSLRGGYGLTATRTGNLNCINACSTNPPFVQSVSLITPKFPNPTGAIARPPTISTLNSISLDLKVPRIQTYSLSLQHQFRGNWLVSLAGAGNIARNLGGPFNANQPLPDTPYDFNPVINTGTVTPYLYGPYRGYGAITTVETALNAYWNALEIGMQHPIGQNLFLTVQYTWSHELSNSPGSAPEYGNAIQDPYNPGADYGNSNLNIPQVFAASYIWSLPWYKGVSGWRGIVLGGWKYSGIVTVESGSSLTPGLSIAHAGLATRPNLIGSVTGPESAQEWFNTAAFAAPVAGFYGNATQGVIRGPGLQNYDMAFYKDFHIKERHEFEFRAEFFNIFNHVNFNGVQTALGAGNFGQVTSARDPRILEFALRYQF